MFKMVKFLFNQDVFEFLHTLMFQKSLPLLPQVAEVVLEAPLLEGAEEVCFSVVLKEEEEELLDLWAGVVQDHLPLSDSV